MNGAFGKDLQDVYEDHSALFRSHCSLILCRALLAVAFYQR